MYASNCRGEDTPTYIKEEDLGKMCKSSLSTLFFSANGANAIGIIIPCHRIIGSNGDLVGYGGGLAAKKKLLEIENNLFS